PIPLAYPRIEDVAGRKSDPIAKIECASPTDCTETRPTHRSLCKLEEAIALLDKPVVPKKPPATTGAAGAAAASGAGGASPVVTEKPPTTTAPVPEKGFPWAALGWGLLALLTAAGATVFFVIRGRVARSRTLTPPPPRTP